MRYDITTWVGGETDEMWRTWGRRRAQKAADEAIARYKQRGLTDWEVGIFNSGDSEMRWFFSAEYERKGDPPLQTGDLDFMNKR